MLTSSRKGQETPWAKAEWLVMSPFSFSHCVFKRFVLQTRKKKKRASVGKDKFFPKQQILDSSKLKEFANDSLNLMKMAERLEYIVGKGETYHCEQFLFFPQYFQKTCTADT